MAPSAASKKKRFCTRVSSLVVICFTLLLFRHLFDGGSVSTDQDVLESFGQSRQIASGKYCDDASGRHQCVFDIGFNTGQDSLFYLNLSPHTRVVGIEANPILVDAAQEKFLDDINDGRLKLLNIGLVGQDETNGVERPKQEFWVNTANDKFSSFKKRSGCRSFTGETLDEHNTTYCRRVDMNTMSCSDLIKEFGTPVYMKIDIEGMDTVCLQSLEAIPFEARPEYVSREGVSVEGVKSAARLGYSGLKVVNQAVLQKGIRVGDAMRGHSGPWGEDAEDVWVGKDWQATEELVARLHASERDGSLNREKGWYDLHMKKQ